ncbi:hypothetical protein [Candidatus Magnetobacterium casense]|uniref:Uncharacterized protein n=1 Tax=Candidatus Magnetobacterium casense TaxID=1455061 RepID=A0ABS6RWW8_9BACT|nr:hypothetical protein [Candidatus Magnetobacterium casensis]MBV6341081.1 hypothetical protein [Candidatus Magnetobacterium casensis]
MADNGKKTWFVLAGVVAVLSIVTFFYTQIDSRVASCPKITKLETQQENLQETVADLASTQRTMAGIVSDLVINQKNIKDVIRDWVGVDARIVVLETNQNNMEKQLDKIQITLDDLLKELRKR